MGCRRGARIWFGAGGFQRGSAGGLGLWRVAIGPRWLAERTVADGVAGVLLAGAVRGFCELGHQVHLEIRPREGLGLANVIAENKRGERNSVYRAEPSSDQLGSAAEDGVRSSAYCGLRGDAAYTAFPLAEDLRQES